MCGLIGVAVKNNFGFTAAESKIANELLYMDALRGEDSTGVCLVKNDGDVSVVKKATWAPSFLCSKPYQELDTAAFKKGKMFLGHNRKATVGAISSENAHPFIVQDEFILMHNGSLFTHKHLADTTVDSEAIAIYLHDNWDDDATPEQKAKVLAYIGGAWALVWYDMRTEKLNIVRNSQRPLNVAEHNGNIFWASDEHMLRCGLSRNNVTVTVKSLPAYTLLTFDGTVLQEVALPTAPFFPSPAQQQPTTHGGKKTEPTTGCDSNAMSKNTFKKFLKFMVGKKITFNVEDFVEVHGKWNFYGDKTEWEFSHEITGLCANEDLLSDVVNNYSLAEGTISAAYRDRDTGHVKFTVNLIGAYKNVETTACH